MLPLVPLPPPLPLVPVGPGWTLKGARIQVVAASARPAAGADAVCRCGVRWSRASRM
jgi:hypothetical protein